MNANCAFVREDISSCSVWCPEEGSCRGKLVKMQRRESVAYVSHIAYSRYLLKIFVSYSSLLLCIPAVLVRDEGRKSLRIVTKNPERSGELSPSTA